MNIDSRPMFQQLGAVTLTVILAVNSLMLVINMNAISDNTARVRSIENRADNLREEILTNREMNREILKTLSERKVP